MIKGFFQGTMTKLILGTHLGDFSDEVSLNYQQAVSFALQNGINSIDGAINYRGMRSEKDEGAAIQRLIHDGNLKREELCVSSKAGLLFGDITEKLNPRMYLEKILKPQGISETDFFEYDGLYQTLNPVFFETALEKSRRNLGLETIDIHYIHIPEITRSGIAQEDFYDRMERLFRWYEGKVLEGKIRQFGIALEFMGKEPGESRWHFELEELMYRALKAGNGKTHFKHVIYEYNLLCPYPMTVTSQTVENRVLSLADACRRLGLETEASMPFAMGSAFRDHSVQELLTFALGGADHVIVGSKNPDHIRELLSYI